LWLPALFALAYVVAVLVNYHEIIASINVSSDVSVAAVS